MRIENVQGELVAWATRLYNTAYHAGHHDTVEGCYTHVYPQDMDSYHEDIVQEWLVDNPQPAEQQPAPDVAVKSFINKVEKIAMSMKAPNIYTPQLMEACVAMRAALAAHRKQGGVSDAHTG